MRSAAMTPKVFQQRARDYLNPARTYSDPVHREALRELAAGFARTDVSNFPRSRRMPGMVTVRQLGDEGSRDGTAGQILFARSREVTKSEILRPHDGHKITLACGQFRAFAPDEPDDHL
jgi:hypothetical protein